MDKSVYKRQFEENKNHWWFESRKKIVQNILKKNIKKKKIKILDFGCGVGINLEMLSKFGDLTAYDDNKIVLKFIKKKFFNRKIRFTNTLSDKKKYDLIIAMDVIEHINDDKKIVEKLNKKLLKNGKILITVPAYNFLFTTKDKILHHKRRYSKKSILNILKPNFKKIKCSYYNFFLAPLIIPTLLFYKIFNIEFIDKVEKKGNNLLNYLFKKIFSSERYILNNINFPFGISIIYLGRKK